MKIVAINGSPRKNGNTAQVLEVVRREVEAAGVEFQVFQPGAKVHPCMALAETSVYRTTCPANSVMKSTKSLILLDNPGSFSFNAIKGGSSR